MNDEIQHHGSSPTHQSRGKCGVMSSRSKLVVPEIDGAIYRWQFGDLGFEVDAAQGARISKFGIGAENILTGPDVNALNFGSTFWTSPQTDWAWPPIAAIDSAPYTVTGEGADLFFQSAPGEIKDPAGEPLCIAVGKRFRVNSDHETVAIDYTIENRGDKLRTVAPWEISRLRTGGLSFFPAGVGVQPHSTLKVRESGGAIWFDYDKASITTEHQKLFAHGSEGWVAHADIARRLLFIKTFPQIEAAEQAPGEAEIELYADPEHTYIEVEQQGAYRPIEPGQNITWTVTWRLRRLPPGIEVAPGNKDLLALARAFRARD
jgi:hypothetical protein